MRHNGSGYKAVRITRANLSAVDKQNYLQTPRNAKVRALLYNYCCALNSFQSQSNERVSKPFTRGLEKKIIVRPRAKAL